ncbi:MAG TPA: hypothetical protein VEL11_07975, partial [Candidatus Bathyarchaeia archaeon]|nr:hypothetical protein [Candidatus Bathyarchaeia archaeon]
PASSIGLYSRTQHEWSTKNYLLFSVPNPWVLPYFIAYPATAPNRNPPPAEKRKSSTGNSEVSTPWLRLLWLLRLRRG